MRGRQNAHGAGQGNHIAVFQRTTVGADTVFRAVRCKCQKDLPLSAVLCRERDHQDHSPKRQPRQQAERRHLAYAGERKVAHDGDALQIHSHEACRAAAHRRRDGQKGTGQADRADVCAYAAETRARNQRKTSHHAHQFGCGRRGHLHH